VNQALLTQISVKYIVNISHLLKSPVIIHSENVRKD